MKNLWATLKLPALMGLALTLPMILLELVNRRDFSLELPFPLFAFLWLLMVVFWFILLPLIQTVRMGGRLRQQPASLALKIVFLFIIAAMWIGILRDQWPCFMGVPNCD